MSLLIAGIVVIAAVLTLFWLMEKLASPMLHRIAYSGLIARFAVLGAVFVLLGLLIMLSDYFGS